MKHYTEKEWKREQYKGKWDDCPYFRSMVDRGELPPEYIGRRTVMVNEHDGNGCTLLTEGVHFTINDAEGRKYTKEAANDN